MYLLISSLTALYLCIFFVNLLYFKVTHKKDCKKMAKGKPLAILINNNIRINSELIHYFFIRYSAERACAVKLSPRPNIDAVFPNSDAPSAEHIIRLERF